MPSKRIEWSGRYGFEVGAFVALGLALIGLVLFASSAGATATWLQAGDVSTLGHDSTSPDIALDPIGHGVVVWENGSDSGSQIIQAAVRAPGFYAVTGEPGFYGVTGDPTTENTRVDLTQPGTEAQPEPDAFEPQVAMDADGDALAVWTRKSAAGGNDVIEAAAWSVTAHSWTSLGTISDPDEQSGEPRVAIDSAGNATVAWIASSALTTDGVRVRHRFADGAWSSAAIEFSDPVGDATDLSVAGNGDGDAVAVWVRNEGDPDIGNESRTLRAAVGSAASGTWSAAESVAPTSAESTDTPQVTFGQGSEVLAVWTAGTSGGYTVVATATRNASTGSWSAPELISSEDLARGRQPQVAANASGEAVVVWAGTPIEGIAAIRARHRDADGSWSGDTSQLSSSKLDEDDPRITTEAGDPQVAIDSSGNAVATWLHFSGYHDLVESRVYQEQSGWGSLQFLSAAGENAVAPRVEIDANGNAMSAWQRFNGDWQVVQSAGYDPAGPVLNDVAIPTQGIEDEKLSFSVTPLDAWMADVSVSWTFGDGQVGSGQAQGGVAQMTRHAYAEPGTYAVSLTATDAIRNVTTLERTVTIDAVEQPIETEPGTEDNPQSGSGTDTAAPSASQDASASVADSDAPKLKVRRPRPKRRYRGARLHKLRGTAKDSLSGVASVEYALALSDSRTWLPARSSRGTKKRCHFVRSSGAPSQQGESCRKLLWRSARGTTAWKLTFRKRLPAGSYRLYVRAIDTAGNTSAVKRVRFRVV